jgi:hypothetical protein
MLPDPFINDRLYYAAGRLNGRYGRAKRPVLQARLAPVQAFFETHKVQIR